MNFTARILIVWNLYVCSNINIYESILTIILLMLPSIPPECADLITSRDRPPIVEETLVTVNKSTTVSHALQNKIPVNFLFCEKTYRYAGRWEACLSLPGPHRNIIVSIDS